VYQGGVYFVGDVPVDSVSSSLEVTRVFDYTLDNQSAVVRSDVHPGRTKSGGE
jgi:hypothetical protein